MKLRPPVLCYPVCDLESECPVGWTPGKSYSGGSGSSGGSSSDGGGGSAGTMNNTTARNSSLTIAHATTTTSTAAAAATVQLPRLQDCLQLKPGSTVGDVFEALKRGVLSSSAAIVQGEFVRADGRSLQRACVSGSGAGGSGAGRGGSSGVVSGSVGKVFQLKKDSIVDATNCVLRIQTNRKSVWQGGAESSAATVPAAAVTSSIAHS